MMPEARYGHARDLPPLDTDVILTMADGTEFKGRRVVVAGERDSGWAWATTDEHEPAAPECWDDGVCWGSAANGRPSEQPVTWRHI